MNRGMKRRRNHRLEYGIFTKISNQNALNYGYIDEKRLKEI